MIDKETNKIMEITIDPAIFRAYDIRGIVTQNLTAETVFLIGQAIGSLVQERGGQLVVIARDGRLSGPILSEALARGLLTTGCDVMDIGMVPTPILYFATHHMHHCSGVMLTGSHNPPDYNGLKMVIQGKTLAEQEIQDLYQRIQQKNFMQGVGKKIENNITPHYVASLLKNIRLAKPLRVVVDAGNGVTGQVAPALFRALGCEVQELFCDVNGTFPNHHPDPSQPENMQDLIKGVLQTKADIGLAFDGDGDRLGIVTNLGQIIYPDRLLMLFAKTVLTKIPRAKIIYDVKCTNLLADLIKSLHGDPIMWKTGHSLIKAKLAETKAMLAGEMSGHFFFCDRWYGFDDALYAGARLLEILSLSSEKSSDIFAAIPASISTPELKVLVNEKEKFPLMQQLIDAAHFTEEHQILTLDGLRVNFNQGWGLVRPSNTTPYLILRFEAVNEDVLGQIQKMFRDLMLSVKPDLILPF